MIWSRRHALVESFSQRRWILAALFWMLLSAAVVGVWWSLPFPYTHDAENHLARFMNTAAAIRQGQIPPRFAPDVASGYGFPVLHYNYPLANLLAVPFVWIKLHPATIFALQAWGALSLGSLAVWQLCRTRFSVLASFAGALSFLSSSALISMLVFRGTIGEIWAYALAPVVLWSVWLWIQKSSLRNWWLMIFAMTAFGLSHNVLLIMFAPWIGCAVLWMAWKSRQLPAFLAAAALSIGFTLWFWIPALFELSLVVLQNDQLATQASAHTLDWLQIWWSPLHFGFSFVGSLDSLGFGLGVPAALMVCLAAGAGLHFWTSRSTEKRVAPFWIWILSAIGVSLFLTSHASWQIWDQVSFLSLFQFPWRWLALTSLALVPVTAWVFDNISAPSSLWRAALLTVLLMHTAWMLSLTPADTVGQGAAYYRLFPNTTTTRNENRPRGLGENVLPAWKPEPSVQEGSAEIQVESWNGSRRRYVVQASEPVIIVEPTIYFPGWQVKSNNQDIQIESDVAGGLLAYRLPGRSEPYEMYSSFTARTPARWAGEGLTVFTAGAAVAGSWWWSKSRKRAA